MQIQSKPYLLLQKEAYELLLQKLKLQRQSQPVDELPEINHKIELAQNMLDTSNDMLNNIQVEA